MNDERIKLAKSNFDMFLRDGLIKKAKDPVAQKMYMKNARLSLNTAGELMDSSIKPYLWVIVVSYYSMFYAANAALLGMGYKVSNKIVHKVTNEALIVLVMPKLSKKLMEEYEETKTEALEIASVKAEEIVNSYGHELEKRSKFQYDMLEEMKAAKAKTSFERAKKFLFEMHKLVNV